jgi:aminoglycoside phosphotransferase (APT) family kinase protein
VLSPDDVDEIARVYGLGGGPRLTGTVERGEQGQVWQLETDRGMWAVKTAFGVPEELDGEDADFQTAAHAAGVPVPAVARTQAGEVFAVVGGVHVRAYEWVDICPPDRTLDPAEVGRVVAAMHRVEFEGRRPEHLWYTDPVGAATWDDLIGDLAAAGAPFADDMARIRGDLVALEALIEPPRALRTCHRDLWADNLRPTAAGGKCVIDWENCGLADPGQELSGVLFEFWGGDPDRARALYGAYRGSGGPGVVDHRGSFTMTIAQLGHITEISCRAWLDPSETDEERRRQVGRVAECTDDPLTVDVIDAILDAVGGAR